MKIRIDLVQMRAEKGAIDANLKAVSGFIAEADKRGVDIIGLPEANITGYHDPVKYPGAIIATDGAEMDALLRMTRGRKPTVLAGLIEKNPAGKPFITQIVVQDGKITGRYRKRILGDDEEAGWFCAGSEIAVFQHKNLKYGIAICADIGCEDIFAEYARQEAQIVFLLAAPGLYGDQSTRDWRSGFQWWEGECEKYLKNYAKKYGIWIAVATQAGRTIDEDFPGGGYVYTPDGRRLYATRDWNPGAVHLELDLKNIRVSEI
ncbi:MAG: carbon-nitrogen hydrolase family protein [Dehalococcoidales bacterium]|jgi:predicted amidohydrolase